MFPPLSEIRVLRRRLGLTQQQLARLAGVSQSLIAKIEYGTLQPSYAHAVAIFEVLETHGRQQELSARQVMSARIVSVRPSDSLRQAVRKFREHDISQLPVLEGGHAVGVVSENDALSALVEGHAEQQVADVMEEAPPTVSPETALKAVSGLLRYCSLVVVAERGKPLGVISRADLLEPLFGKATAPSKGI